MCMSVYECVYRVHNNGYEFFIFTDSALQEEFEYYLCIYLYLLGVITHCRYYGYIELRPQKRKMETAERYTKPMINTS